MAEPSTPQTDEDTLARREAQKQWEANPCGASTVRGVEPESLEWFREARRVRYNEYAPWLRATTGIEHVRDKDVLEIGVGLGSDHFTLASGGNRMTALDLSREHLRLTQRHLSLEGFSTTAVHGDMERMPFADASFVWSIRLVSSTTRTTWKKPSRRSGGCCGPAAERSSACITVTACSSGFEP